MPIVLVAPFFLWGTAMVAMKTAIPDTTAFFVAGFRLLPAGLLILLFCLFTQRAQPNTRKAWGWILLFALVDGSMFQGFLAAGLERTNAGLGSVIIDSQPLAVALLSSWLFAEVIGRWGWLGLAIGILGISFIGLPDEWFFHAWNGSFENIAFNWQGFLNSGELYMLLASLSMAVGTVMIPYISKEVDPVVATGWHMVLGSIPIFAISWFQETSQWQNLTLLEWADLGYASIFGSAIAYGLFFYLASKGNLTSLSALTFLTPIFALIFGRIFLAESLSLLQWSGVALTLVSIYLINQRKAIEQKFQGLS
jgi:drug/metabolite transporter (DMT)-like permease